LFSYRFPVSVKGVCLVGGKIVLVQNERREWDLPGGKLRRNESIEDCLQREFREELGIPVQVESLVGATRIRIKRLVSATVLVLLYRCHTRASVDDLKISHENLDMGTFTREEIGDIDLPETYRTSIEQLFAST
jgi:8-oxo-dGTP pyrophosphatase MutT (NUDIX family)